MFIFPISFWAVIAVLVVGAVLSIKRIKDGTGIPMLAVLGTVAVWYVGDAFYNDYAHSYATIFEPDVLQEAWWQVAWFLVVFLAAVPFVHEWFNARHLRRQSGVLQLYRFGIAHPRLQRQLDILFDICIVVYAIIVAMAACRLKGEVIHFLCPYLGYKAEPWGRARIGTGIDALLSFAEYIQLMVTTVFGVLAAVSINRRTRFLSFILCFISWPYFLFDRTRNTILAVVIPAILSWAFLRLQGSVWKKIFALACFFILVNTWMAIVIQNRSTTTITEAIKEKGFNIKAESEVHHEGLNMFEELCWINTFMEQGTYQPNWGRRYFAELVNPIPRALWHNKPLIGIDYAQARGMGMGEKGGGDSQANVYATISTGMIGQGVVNFGGILGPAAAALLMSFWAALLARQDLHIFKLGRLPLYALGLILTFNLGRDITFITLYPFVFGVAVLWWLDRHNPSDEVVPTSSTARPSQVPASPAGRTHPGGPQMPMRRRKIITRSYPFHRSSVSPPNSNNLQPPPS